MKSVLLALALICGFASAQDAASPNVFPDLGLTIQPPKLEKLEFEAVDKGQVRGVWTGKLGTVAVEAVLLVLPSTEFGFGEATDVVSLALDNMRDPKRGDPSFQWDTKRLVGGPFGYAPYAQVASGALRESTKIVGTRFLLGGLLKDAGYVIQVEARPAPGETQAKVILDWLEKGLAYAGPVRETKWTDAEAKSRWEQFSPPSARKKFEPAFRTAHYLILTDSSSSDKFGQHMEKCHAAIKKLYPFDDVPGQKLMPVFLFRTADEYYEYYMGIAGISREEAAKSKGHAWKDYYATYFEAINDPVHIHEATHQIFANRLALHGGGSWFQEGVAEYIETKKNDRNMAASRVKKGRHVPLEKFVETESLLYSAEDDVSGESAADNGYKQAALLIEFLHEDKWAAPKFQQFIHAVGKTPPNDLPAIERAVHGVYGIGLKELEAKWVEYCKKR